MERQALIPQSANTIFARTMTSQEKAKPELESSANIMNFEQTQRTLMPSWFDWAAAEDVTQNKHTTRVQRVVQMVRRHLARADYV